MVTIPAGSFIMGSSADETGHWENEGPEHRVTISEPFALGRFEVTFDEYDQFVRAVGRDLPPDFGEGRGRRPVNNVSWTEAHAYCTWLGDQTGQSYRLPSEAEWEYAARAGTTSRYAFGDEISNQEANFGDEHQQAIDVGSYAANAWGLHDMHGNLAEWVEDRWHSTYAAAPSDGSAWTIDPPGSERVFRGGSWNDGERDVRSAARYPFDPHAKGNVFGFRCARDQADQA